MIVKAQDGNCYNIHTISTQGKNVYCQDTTDKRKKRLLGEYDSIEKATIVFDMVRKNTTSYFEMPMN